MDGSLFFHVGNRIAAVVNPGSSGADGQSQVKSILWDPARPSQGVPLNITLNKLFWDSTEVYLGEETFIDTIVETFVMTWMNEDGQTHPVTEMHCETEILDTILHTNIIGEIIESWVEYHTRVNTRDEARTIIEDDMPVPITWVDEWTEVETWKHDDEGRHVELDYIRHTDTNRARRVHYEYELLGTTVHHDVIGYETESWMEYITQMNTWYETFMESVVHTEIRTEPVYGPFEPVEVPCYYIHDHNKNVVGLSDEHGNLRARYQYDPYGNITRQQGELARENPIRFSSERWNDKLGIVQYLYRDYNPTSQRWLSRDPIAEQGGMNLYGFVGNDPVNRWDLWGWLIKFEPLSDSGYSGMELPYTGGIENGNCIGNACGLGNNIQPPVNITDPIGPDFLENYLKQLNPMQNHGKCSKGKIVDSNNENLMNSTPCKNCQREVICLVHLKWTNNHKNEVNFDIHCIGRTIPPKSAVKDNGLYPATPFQSKNGIDGEKILVITGVNQHFNKYVLQESYKEGLLFSYRTARYCCNKNES